MNQRRNVTIRRAFLIVLATLVVTPFAIVAGGAEENPTRSEKRDDVARGRNRRPVADPPIKDLRLNNDDEPAEARIERTLGKATAVNFIEMTLEDSINYLKEYHQIPIWIDKKALSDAEVSIEQPVTLQMSGRFESVLNLLLDPLDLEWLIQDEVLKVTTRERASAKAQTRAFNVQDLIDAGHSPDDLIDSIVRCVEPATWVDEGGLGAISHSGGVLICRQTQRVQSEVLLLLEELQQQAEDRLEEARHDSNALITLKAYRTQDYPADELAKAIPRLIALDSWTKTEVKIEAVKGALLVRQTPHVHHEIEKLLKQLSAAQETASVAPVQVESGF